MREPTGPKVTFQKMSAQLGAGADVGALTLQAHTKLEADGPARAPGWCLHTHVDPVPPWGQCQLQLAC